jgi:hypothetical protein
LAPAPVPSYIFTGDNAMLTVDRATEEVELFKQRVEELYTTVRGWATSRYPGTTFTYGTVTRDEESTGVFTVRSMDVHVPGRPVLHVTPYALFNLGARGQVRVSGWFSSEPLMWVTGDEANEAGAEPDEEEMVISRPVYPNVPRGWVWLSWRSRSMVPLTETVFWDQVTGEAILRNLHGQSA